MGGGGVIQVCVVWAKLELGETLLGETLLGETLLDETLLGETFLGETLYWANYYYTMLAYKLNKKQICNIMLSEYMLAIMPMNTLG